jgi:hypothetical protein
MGLGYLSCRPELGQEKNLKEASILQDQWFCTIWSMPLDTHTETWHFLKVLGILTWWDALPRLICKVTSMCILEMSCVTIFKSFAQGRHHSDWLHTWNSPNTILQQFGVWSSENNFPQARMDITLGSSIRNGAHSRSAWNDIWFVRFQNFMNATHFEEI